MADSSNKQLKGHLLINLLILNFSEHSDSLKWGQEKLIANLISELSLKKKFKISAIITRQGETEKFYKSKGIMVECLNFRKFFPIKNILKTIRLIKNNQIDIIHSNETRSIIYASLFKILFPSVKLIASKHDKAIFFPTGFKMLFRKYLYLWVERILFMIFFKKITTATNANKKSIVGFFKLINRKIIVIPYGITPIHYSNQYHTGKVVKIGVIGRLENFKKGQDIFIKSIKHVINKTKKKILFYIIGDGPDLENLKKLTENLNVKHLVKFMGYRSNIQKVLEEIDIIAMPSYFEGMPLLLLDSIHAGKPVITSDIDEFREIITDNKNGILFKKGDEKDLARKVLLVVENANLRKRIGNNLKKLKNKYILDRMVADYIKVYSNCR